MKKALVLAFLASFSAPLAYADQGGFSNSGGSTQVSSGVIIHSNVATPAGTLTINCPATAPARCAGGSFTYASNDGTVTLSASFTSATFTESCSGGGRGGHVTCGYSFTGYMSGTWSVNGAAQAVNGVTYQGFRTGGAAATGTTVYNSAYSPFYYSDTEQIHRSDDLQGTNQISFGGQGSDVGQFYGAYGIALDSAGRIYVADTYNCRIVRIDDMNGTNWTSYGGTCGAGQGQFYDPIGIAIDSAGGIYVMDTGNSRLVRIDDMNGTNWISYGTVGNGVGQFASYESVAVDASNRIYVADTGNQRIVRIDDMNGTNWTVLTQSPPVNGVSQSFSSPAAVAVDAAGKIYVADNQYYAPAVIRVDDMTGANWTSLYITAGGSAGLNSISVDSGGTVFTGGGGVKLVDNMAGVLTSSGTIGPLGSYYVFGVTPVPVPSPRPSALGFSPATLTFALQDIGTSSNAQPVTITNFGGNPLNFSSIVASGDFAETNDCPTSLVVGASCTVSVSYAPTIAGPATGQLTLTDDSGNLGASQTVALAGTGSPPRHLSLSPATLNFCCPPIGDNPSQTVTVTNTSGVSVGIAGIAMSGDPAFAEGTTCGSLVSAGATCTVTVTFTPAAYATFTSTLIVTEGDGAQETVSVSGTSYPDN